MLTSCVANRCGRGFAVAGLVSCSVVRPCAGKFRPTASASAPSPAAGSPAPRIGAANQRRAGLAQRHDNHQRQTASACPTRRSAA